MCRALPLDLHVLGTPPAFILSQDQTLQKRIRSNFSLLTYLKTILRSPEGLLNELTLICTTQFLTYIRCCEDSFVTVLGHFNKVPVKSSFKNTSLTYLGQGVIRRLM
jgi:hypothetical protein